MQPESNNLFEVSWEVCNKVGGIYTVVSSKAPHMMAKYENYYLIGPYFPQKTFGTFEETLPPEHCKEAFDTLKHEGIDCHCGTWLVKGNPNVILIDFTNYATRKNDIKKKLWDTHKIDSLHTEWFDYDEPVVFATTAGRVIQELAKTLNGKTTAHFHEWLTGAGLLHLKNEKTKVATVFTTHATTLGRTIAGTDHNLYEVLETLNPDENAAQRGSSINAKHLLEKAAAQNADIFTTVSDITGIEAEKILGKKPDLLLPNGLDLEKFPTFEQASIKHSHFKARIKQFITYYFFPYNTFDLDNTLIYFLAGRYEFFDKGIDTFITALSKLNEKLKQEKSQKTIITFFWVPGNVKAIRQQLLENKTYYLDIKDSLDDETEAIKSKILSLFISKKDISTTSLFEKDFLEDIKPKLVRLSRHGTPPLSTHELYNENTDAIITALKNAGLDNSENNKVKVVFYPIYLTGADGLLDTSYYESMQGSHLGIFPSYYEPWGYTPLEAAALGVSSLTTDLSGFGNYICKECDLGQYPGVFVLKRHKRTNEQITNDLANTMHTFANLTTEERVKNKIAAKKIATTADWKNFAERYIEAHNMAVRKNT